MKTKMRKGLMVSIMLMIVLGILTSCVESDQEGDLKDVDLPGPLGWEYIQDKGEIVVGLDDTFAPMGFRDEAGKLVGLDIDLAEAVGKELGLKVKFKPIDWDTKEMELMSKNIDCIWNGMSATEERQKKMALSKKYLNNRIIIMTRDDNVVIEKVEDLKKYNIGTQSDSAALETMKGNEKYDVFADNISEYKTYDAALMDMQTGRLDCMVVDEVLGEYKNSKLKKKFDIATFNFGNDYYAIGCRLGEEDVAEKLNEALENLIESGKAEEISNKWFGKNIVILEDYQ